MDGGKLLTAADLRWRGISDMSGIADGGGLLMAGNVQ
jgi:hypothetical protein